MSKWCSWRYGAGKGRTGSGHVLFLTEEHSVCLSDISHLEGWPCLLTDAERVKKGEANSVFRRLLCWDVGRIWGRGAFCDLWLKSQDKQMTPNFSFLTHKDNRVCCQK